MKEAMGELAFKKRKNQTKNILPLSGFFLSAIKVSAFFAEKFLPGEKMMMSMNPARREEFSAAHKKWQSASAPIDR